MNAIDIAAAGIGLTLMTAIIIGIFFVSAFGFYKMNEKAGEAGWKALIPYYRSYIRFKYSWNTNPFWIFLVATILFQNLSSIEGYVIVDLISIALAIVAFVVGLKLDIRTAKSFGKSAIWGVLLYFLPFIVSYILGLGKAQYIGNTTVAAAEE